MSTAVIGIVAFAAVIVYGLYVLAHLEVPPAAGCGKGARDTSCPYCGAPLRHYKVLRRTHRGRVGNAYKEWACGTRTQLDLCREVEFERGDSCLEKGLK